MSSDSNTRAWTRRAVLAATATSGFPLLTGCSNSTNQTATQPTDGTTAEPTSEHSTSDEQDATFTDIYTNTFDSDAAVLSPEQRTQYADPSRFETTSHLLEAVTETVVATASITKESQNLTRYLKHALHNDLGYSAAEVRVFGRNTARSGTYTAIFHRKEKNWAKDLTLIVQGDHGYRRHAEAASEDPRGPDRYLDALWNPKDPITASATNYPALTALSWEQAGSDATQKVLDWISAGNDHIIVDDSHDVDVIGYMTPAARELARIQDITEQDTFSEEMHIVEAATETFHNSAAPYLEMQLQDSVVIPVPTHTYRSPELLYLDNQ